jgi:hypothetical protein
MRKCEAWLLGLADARGARFSPPSPGTQRKPAGAASQEDAHVMPGAAHVSSVKRFAASAERRPRLAPVSARGEVPAARWRVSAYERHVGRSCDTMRALFG